MTTTTKKAPIGTKQNTGETCVESGKWEVQGGATTAPIAKGNRMPPYKERAVTWVLKEYA